MTKNAAKILLESLQKVRQRSFWRYLFGSVLTHTIRTNEPFNPIFFGKEKILHYFCTHYGHLWKYKYIKRQTSVEEKMFNKI